MFLILLLFCELGQLLCSPLPKNLRTTLKEHPGKREPGSHQKPSLTICATSESNFFFPGLFVPLVPHPSNAHFVWLCASRPRAAREPGRHNSHLVECVCLQGRLVSFSCKQRPPWLSVAGVCFKHAVSEPHLKGLVRFQWSTGTKWAEETPGASRDPARRRPSITSSHDPQASPAPVGAMHSLLCGAPQVLIRGHRHKSSAQAGRSDSDPLGSRGSPTKA